MRGLTAAGTGTPVALFSRVPNYIRRLLAKISFVRSFARRLAPRWVGCLVAFVLATSGLAALSLHIAMQTGFLSAAGELTGTDVAAKDDAGDEDGSDELSAVAGVPAVHITMDDGGAVDDSGATDDGHADESGDSMNIAASDVAHGSGGAASAAGGNGAQPVANVEIPDYLRVDSIDEGRMLSIYNQLGLIETILPGYGLEKPLGLGRESILDDSENRVTEEFKIEEGLRSRVGFWFDIYSKYDSNHRIIHHSLYPWIIYKVIDVSMIINSDKPSHLWLRRQRADRLVKEETLKVLVSLKRLAARRDVKKMSDGEKEIATALAPLGGNLRQQALRALRAVRVQTGQRDFFVEGLRVSSRYLATMEKIFVAHKMPYELTRIPLVESSFNKQATSKVGASGIWQFMNGTGRKYMMVDGAIDERRSPFKATEAAARLLKENHMILYRSWPLAVTAWNHGPGGVRKAMTRAGSRDLGKIIARYHSRSFDFASSNFYSEFLGALYAERYSDELFGELQRHPQETLQAVKLARAVRFNQLLKVSGMTAEDFLAINPELTKAAKKNLMLPRGFRLHIPEWAIENLDQLFAQRGDGGKRET